MQGCKKMVVTKNPGHSEIFPNLFGTIAEKWRWGVQEQQVEIYLWKVGS